MTSLIIPGDFHLRQLTRYSCLLLLLQPLMLYSSGSQDFMLKKRLFLSLHPTVTDMPTFGTQNA